MAFTIAQIGEFGLIQLIREILPPPSAQVLIGIGEDAAVIPPCPVPMVITTDAMVQDVHFCLGWGNAADLAHKALASTISDLAAKAAEPAYSVITLGLPPETPVDWVRALYITLAQRGLDWGVECIGGDTVRSPLIWLSITAWGRQLTPQPMRLDQARPGETILVTGTLGDAAAGLDLFQQGQFPAPPPLDELQDRFLRPTPRIAAMRAILRHATPSSMTDISDGLARDLPKLCHASGVGARLTATRWPVRPALRQFAPDTACQYAWRGGEDYELLFTLPSAQAQTLLAQWDPAQCPLTAIGEIRPAAEGILIEDNPNLDIQGFDHFLQGK